MKNLLAFAAIALSSTCHGLIGGHAAGSAEFPWTGKILLPNGAFSGSAVIISPRVVLTVRHVVGGFNPLTPHLFQRDGQLAVAPTSRYLLGSYNELALLIFPEDTFAGWYPLYRGSSDVPKWIQEPKPNVPGILDHSTAPTLTLVGYGWEGDRYDTPWGWAVSDRRGNKRVGLNKSTIPLLTPQWPVLQYDKDGNGYDLIGDGPEVDVDEECGFAGGDSGGPTFLLDGQTAYVAGIHHARGDSPFFPAYTHGFGDSAGDIRISPFADEILEWMEMNGLN